MRILVLILASDDGSIYSALQEKWKKYMNKHPKIDCYFYKGDLSLPKPAILSGDTLWVRANDDSYHCYEKTIAAFAYFEPLLYKYDFVFRPNLSSFLVLDSYYEACKTFPKRKFCSAEINSNMSGIPFSYPSGAGFTLSCDIVRQLVINPQPQIINDDVSIGAALVNWGIPIHPAKRVNILEDTEFRTGDAYHYRIRTGDREKDLLHHDYLISFYYSSKPDKFMWNKVSPIYR
jgi:hypothetical protein